VTRRPYMVEVILDDDELALADEVARIRFDSNRAAGATNRRGSGYDSEILGVQGEIAFARWAGVEPNLIDLQWAGSVDCVMDGIARRLDVKASRGWVLKVEPQKVGAPVDAYVLVHRSKPPYTFTIVGWEWADIMTLPDNLMVFEYQGREYESFAKHGQNLRSPEELKA